MAGIIYFAQKCFLNPYSIGIILVYCIRIFAVTICILFFQGCYLLKQGFYIIRYNSKAQSIDKMLGNSHISQNTKDFLLLVKEIRSYAFDSLGLIENDNYTRYVEIDKDYLVDVVSASDELAFNQHTWCYPFFGCFPYKGYFERKDAEKQASKLSRKGLDTYIGRVDAFSTLGFFKDPIYSFMEEYSVFGIASLIFHEQTHATVFLKNRIQFNEELATFIGTEGALRFIRMKYGDGSDAYRNAILAIEDSDTYMMLMRRLYKRLAKLYKSNIPDDKKREEKQKIIQNCKNEIMEKYNQFFKTDLYSAIGKAQINNAVLAIRMTYTLDLDIYYELYELYDRDLKKMMDFFKTLEKCRNDPKEIIRAKLKK